MKTSTKGAVKRLIFSLLLAAGATGCAVYSPPYAGGYDSYPYSYGYPTYVGPPVTLDLGFQFYDRGRGYYGGHHGFRGHQHGFRGHHGGFRGNHHAGRGNYRRGWR